MAGTNAHFYRTAEGTGLPHDPFNAIVGPRPIGWISSQSRDGVRNLAPYSFFNGFNYHPPIIGFSSIGWKDTVANIEATGNFVWNLATRDLAERMNRTAATLPAHQDEFETSGLTPVPATIVSSAMVLESPVNFECELTQLIQLTTAAGGALDTWLVLGEVVAVHIESDHLVDGIYDTAGPRPILRSGGPANYFEIGPEALFAMPRPS
ncbi:flavin reductase family protein [Mycolicibacterium fluoranthenivorans]|uniref:NADH-FMN oxidoreductase RutF, flavin reductase (DIM6/NTAB) family n=1 Tax=Mycolicibacterium fluoranthenivorans TaxID=258505 RepID=A0A1G4WUG0_9MYCO|nr:flavin reductase family protein [Mycolicibacterium fluoranthenivorans]SCX29855.1 NADH-FMN oxidoreductase RutF, flavin reductase (DIM6/NTAB) family [Mycolicibacterium fluoranthenivorans]